MLKKKNKWPHHVYYTLSTRYSFVDIGETMACGPCVFQTVEPVDQLLQKVDPAKDRELWVKEHKTGNIRPVDMEI